MWEMKLSRTFLRAGYHPAQHSNSARCCNNSIECDAATQMKLDRFCRRNDQKVEQGVVRRVYEQGIVYQGQDHDRR
jgi:hypothetical protein